LKGILYLIIACLLVMGLALAGCPSENGETAVTTKAIPGVTVPATDANPVTTITATAQYTGTVDWAPAHDPFEAGTVYTATVTLTAKAGYTFTGVAADFFTVSGATTVTNAADSGVVTAEFPAAAGTITFAITGPMTFMQGMDHWAGAEMARDEINANGGVDVGGVRHDVALVQVETNEILDVSGVSGTTALTAVIDDVDFVVGGFRSESVLVYREVAVGPNGAGKIFMNCGAATGLLQMSVITDYDSYKYWFKGTPYNEVFLVTSCLRYIGVANAVLRGTLAGARNLYGIPGPGGDWTSDDVEPLKFAILMEDAEWCNPMEAPAIGALTALMGLEYVGTWKCESAASDLEAQLTAIGTANPHIVFTILAGPGGKAYGTQQAIYAPNVFSLGINVEAQDINYYPDTGAEYHMTLDTWAAGAAVTPGALAWFDSFVAKTGRYPGYSAATYDGIKSIIEGVEAVSAANGWDDIADVIDHANIDALIQYLETSQRLGVGANTVYYPLAELDLGGGIYALSLDQVLALYPHVQDLIDNGVYAYDPADWTTLGGHIFHDTLYGPGYQTGIAAQWQEIEGTWKKVCVWPMVFADPATPYWQLYYAGVVDLYGNWNFQYDGTESLIVPDAWTGAWVTPPA
jgi:branched-chain amino acid transport system substrate-binding protein